MSIENSMVLPTYSDDFDRLPDFHEPIQCRCKLCGGNIEDEFSMQIVHSIGAVCDWCLESEDNNFKTK